MMLRDKTVIPKLQQFKSFSQMPIESITADERKTVAVPKLGNKILLLKPGNTLHNPSKSQHYYLIPVEDFLPVVHNGSFNPVNKVSALPKQEFIIFITLKVKMFYNWPLIVVVPAPKAEEMISPLSSPPQKKPRAYAPFKQPRMYGAKIQPKTMPRKKYWTPLFHEK